MTATTKFTMSAQGSGAGVSAIVGVDIEQDSFVEFAVDDNLKEYIHNPEYKVVFTWCLITGGNNEHLEDKLTVKNDSSFGFKVNGAGRYHYNLTVKYLGDGLGDTVAGGAGDIIVK